MPADLEFTGERFIPGVAGEIAYEHWHRYAFARRFAAGRRVLDAACGEGYGTALLAAAATEATGVDLDAQVVAHARSTYAGHPNLRYETGSVVALPLGAGSVDVVVSFETIEHLAAADQPRMLAEFARVLAPGGLLVLSSPNKRRYSDERNYRNPFHRHELYRDDLAQLLDPWFPHRRWFHQAPSFASALWSESAGSDDAGCEAWTGDAGAITPTAAPDGLYYVVVAGAAGGALPPAGPRLSLFSDRNESELARAAANAGEVLRLDALLQERDAVLERHAVALRRVEELVAKRDAELVAVNAARESLQQAVIATGTTLDAARHERGEAIALAETRESALSALRTTQSALQAEQRRLEAALAAQERIIAYRQSVRWWLQLPWLRVRLMWRRWFGDGL